MEAAVSSRLSYFVMFSFGEFIIGMIKPNWIPFCVNLKEAALVVMYWLLFYPQNSTMRDLYGISHSSLEKIIRRLLRNCHEFIHRIVRFPMPETRMRMAVANLDQRLVDRGVTMFLDGTDTRIWVRRNRGEKVKEYYSFKFKKPAFRTQVACLPTGYWIWYSVPRPAHTHDKRCLDESNFAQLLNRNEKALADSGYIGSPVCLCPMKRPRRQADGTRNELPIEDQEMNQLIQKSRAPIERFFGRLKNYFHVLSSPYRHDKIMFRNVFGICLALDNLHRHGGEPEEDYHQKWANLLIPQRPTAPDTDDEEDDDHGPESP